MLYQEYEKQLAHAYIPHQEWKNELYNLETALSVGTIFPQLNQPICEYEWGETKWQETETSF